MIGPRKVDKPLSLYGYGSLGHLAEEIFDELQIPTDFIFDAHRRDCPRPKDVLSVDKKDSLLAICVATEPYQQVIAPLVAAGWQDMIPVWDIIEAFPEAGLHNGWFAGGLSDKDARGISYVEGYLWGWESVKSYLAFLAWHGASPSWNGHEKRERYIHCQDMEKPQPLSSTLADIRKRQRVVMFADAPMDNISIHAEGCELKTLEENMHLFQKYRPAIEVAVYHSRDGLYLIEKYLMDNLRKYHWTFRLHSYMGQAAYIYGMPGERT